MNKIQTLAAALILMLGVSIALTLIFRKPLTYSYDNLPDKLNQTMRKNGVTWAKASIHGDKVVINGTAPSSSEMVLVKTLIQKEAGVSADFMGVKVKDIKTRDDFDSDEEWNEYKKTNTQDGPVPFNNVQPGNSQASAGGQAAPNSGDSQGSDTNKSTGASGSNQTLDDVYTLHFKPQTSECAIENRLQTNDYNIIYKGNTAVIDSRSLSDLDWIAELDETCPLDLKLIRQGKKDEKLLGMRRVDEVRYHLMSSGITSERIITDTQ